MVVSRFRTKLLRPADSGKDDAWSFLVLPKRASDKLPRRGRTTVRGTLDGQALQATLEPDGRLGHWLKVDRALREAAGVNVGDTVSMAISPVEREPEPRVPRGLQKALAACPAARSVWERTTTLARIDWIHWIESAKQAKTRKQRIDGACEMLASGKRRVCCFDPTGYYSKSLCVPTVAE